MGRTVKSHGGLASALFSKVQLRILTLLIGNPARAYHTSEIIKLAKSGTGAVQRELTKLTQAGLLTSRWDSNRKTYQANKQAPIFAELNRILLKTTGLVEPIRNALKPFQNRIRFAFIFGSIAKGTDTANSDVDLMIAGEDLSYSEIFTALQTAEKIIDRPINPKITTPSDWKQTLASENSFLKSIVEQPILFVLGTEHELQGA